MQLFSSLRKWLTDQSQTRRTPARKPTTRFRPQLELLDDRLVPSTLTVTNNLDTGIAGDGSLRGEIAAANSGDTIVFDPSLSGQSIDLYSNDNGGELVINKNLTIEGPSAPLSPVTIAGFYSRVFEVDGAKTVVSLNNLNIMYGTGSSYNPGGAPNGQGGEIWNGGVLTVNACSLSYGSALEGGAIYNAGTLTVSNSTLDYNSAGQRPSFDPTYGGDGGAIYNVGTLTVSNSTLDGNNAYPDSFVGGYGDGGAIYNTGTLTVSNSTLDDNNANSIAYENDGGLHSGGGGIFNAYRATANITGSTIDFNYGAYAGGIYNDGVMTLSGSTVYENAGDGILNDKHGHLTITSKSIVESDSSYWALYSLGWVKISADSVVG